MSVVDTTNLARPTDAIRHRVAERIQARLDTVAAEMIKEVQAQIPEYARPLDPTYARTVRRAVEEVLRHLVGLLEHPDRTEEGWRELFHAIGAGEMHEGRSLDSVHAALRLCTRVGWRWLVDFAAAEGAPLHTLGALAETIFSFLDQVADACAAGYAQAQAAVAGELDRRRRRLLELLLADPPASAAAVAAAAETARWRLPRRLAAVAIDGCSAEPTPPVLAPDILVSVDRAEPCLLVPDPQPRTRSLATALAGLRAAVGPAVATADAVKSLRWARHPARRRAHLVRGPPGDPGGVPRPASADVAGRAAAGSPRRPTRQPARPAHRHAPGVAAAGQERDRGGRPAARTPADRAVPAAPARPPLRPGAARPADPVRAGDRVTGRPGSPVVNR